MVASFPGSSLAPMKNKSGGARGEPGNKAKGGEPGKIYHVRNVISRENLITSG